MVLHTAGFGRYIPFAGLTPSDTPALASFKLITHHSIYLDNQWPPDLMFCHQLKSFHCETGITDYQLPPLAWNGLSELSLVLDWPMSTLFFDMDVSDLLSVLQLSSSLKTCLLQFSKLGTRYNLSFPNHVRTPKDISGVMVTLPHLQKLSITGSYSKFDPFCLTKILEKLCLPDLQELQVLSLAYEIDHSEIISPLPAINLLLCRSRVKFLTMNWMPFMHEIQNFIACFKSARYLEQLSMKSLIRYEEDHMRDLYCGINGHVLEALQSVDLCPNLKMLSLEGVSPSTVHRFIQSNCVKRLRSVYYQIPVEFESEREAFNEEMKLEVVDQDVRWNLEERKELPRSKFRFGVE
ncbi:hypothetical protein BDQ12DRAFT_683477 [Crucibulum laeve]|uniref:Uncharacterized protein n=1 Tax=Crucibulum laeve TaxID=68775 RepID=A0A5C3LYN5_9AGAR|nr:hypothetical protein BDQ12DRAFT_683477 [Crucibulum laeve]